MLLREKTAKYRTIYDRVVKPVRHKYIAHREKVGHVEVEQLFGVGKVQEISRLITFLHALYQALLQQYHNGRKPLLGRVRYSVKAIFESKNHQSTPHEIIVVETKQLMALIEACRLG